MTKHTDPHWEREQEKYQRPIPSREFIMQMLAERGEPLTYDEIAAELKLESEDELEALRRRLKAMLRDGQLLRNRKDGFALVDKMDMVVGRVEGHRDGFGFLTPDEGGGDLFLSAKEMRAVMHGDRVVARVSGLDRRGRKEGQIVEVLERRNHSIVGRLHTEGGAAFVVPNNRRITQDIVVPSENLGGAVTGQIVVVELTSPPSQYRQPVGKVVELLGDHMAPGMEIDVAIRDHELPLEWPDAVEQEIATLTPQVPEDAKQGREDIRTLPLVTIDGEDARDFDDAVYCEKDGRGWRLLVAIADVSHYVKPGTALDEEAKERGNSVYFPERVIPMLPEILSNGLCSINPDVDRLCMVCEMFITPAGVVKDYRFFEGVMRSHARLTYTKAAAILVDQDAALRTQYAAVVPHLEDLYRLYQALRVQRDKRGAIDFDTTETRIVFGADRKIERIIPVIRNDAHKLIEECMIAANVCAGKYLEEKELPTLFRVHEGPGDEKLLNLRAFLSELGLSLGGGEKPEPKHYAKLLTQIQGRPDLHLIQTVMLRSLKQAVYAPDNLGHFGLSIEAYVHFTSPIRRYPDLLVHRAIRHQLSGKPAQKFRYDHNDMVALGENCSATERRADEATRDAVDWLKCEYMTDKVGETFDGLITGVTGFGIFVELKDIYVEGLVHVTALSNDYYRFDPAKHRLLGERTNTIYRLADNVRVRVVRVSLDDRKIDFELADSEPPTGKQTARRTAKPLPKDAGKAATKEAPKKTAKKKRSRRKRTPKAS
ncbi:MAG: ribonuclease R [Gammaproteobacteria bacterium]|nr:ribonuclease R [Gammaproteobacteria bacterium]